MSTATPDGGIVSLVPSLTEAVAALGAGDRLVGVTRYCTLGAPPGAQRVGGTKNPDLDAVVALDPALVLANAEENRAEDVDALRAAGVRVLVTYPRAVADVAPMLVDVGHAVGATALVGAEVGADVARAVRRAGKLAPSPPVPAVTLVWRKPWMAVGGGTYAADLLACCGFANPLSASPARYPRIGLTDFAGAAVVLMPSEPYAFGPDDIPAVEELTGGIPFRFVDGRLLTWHGPSTAEALDVFSALAVELAAHR